MSLPLPHTTPYHNEIVSGFMCSPLLRFCACAHTVVVLVVITGVGSVIVLVCVAVVVSVVVVLVFVSVVVVIVFFSVVVVLALVFVVCGWLLLLLL